MMSSEGDSTVRLKSVETTLLRSVAGERGKWSGGRGVASSKSQPERNVPPPRRRRKPAAFAASGECPLVTSGRFAEWNGCGREGDRADRQPVECSTTARWSRRSLIFRGSGWLWPVVRTRDAAVGACLIATARSSLAGAVRARRSFIGNDSQ